MSASSHDPASFRPWFFLADREESSSAREALLTSLQTQWITLTLLEMIQFHKEAKEWKALAHVLRHFMQLQARLPGSLLEIVHPLVKVLNQVQPLLEEDRPDPNAKKRKALWNEYRKCLEKALVELVQSP